MADDVASLGFAVDSAPLAAGSAALDKLSASAKGAEDATNKLNATSQAAGTAQKSAAQTSTLAATQTKRLADEARLAGSVNDNYTAAQRKVIQSLNDGIAATSLSGRELAIHTALVRANTTEGSRAGAAIALLAGQQFDLSHETEGAGERLSEQRVKFRSLSEAAREFGGPLGGVIQQAGFLTIGSQHLTAGIIATTVAIGGLVAGVVKLIEVEKEAAEIARSGQLANVGGQNIQGLSAAAGFGGIASADTLKGMVDFNKQVDLAKSGVGTLAVLFRANRVEVTNTEDAFLKVADLVKRANSDAERFSIIQQAGLQPTNKMVTFLSQGGDAIKRQADEARKLTDVQLDQAKRMEEKWNEVSTNFERYWKAAILNTSAFLNLKIGPGFFDQLSHLGERTPSQRVDQAFSGPMLTTPGTQGPGTVDPEKLKAQLDLEKQRIAVLGQMVSVDKEVRLAEIDLQIAGIAGAGVTREQRSALLDLARERANGTAQIKAQIDSTNVQTATIGVSASAAAAYTARETILNEAIRNHKILTDADKAAIDKQAQGLGAATQALEKMKVAADIKFERGTTFLSDTDIAIAQKLRIEYGDNIPAALNSWEAAQMRVNAALKQVNDAAGTFASGFLTDLSHDVTATQALQNALTRLEDVLIDMAARKLMANALGGATSGINFASIFGGGGGAGASVAADGTAIIAHGGGLLGWDSFSSRNIHPAYFDNAPKFGGGGIVGGERPVIAHQGEGIFTPGQMAALGRGGGDLNLKQEITFKIDGAIGKMEIAQMIGQGMAIAKSEAVKTSSAALPARQDQARRLGQ